jgi:hypothetical protein
MEHPTRRLDEGETGEPESEQELTPCPKCGNSRIWTWARDTGRIYLERYFTKPGINYGGIPITGDRKIAKTTPCAALMCT